MDARKLLRQQENAKRRRNLFIIAIVATACLWGITPSAAVWGYIGSGLSTGVTNATWWITAKAGKALGFQTFHLEPEPERVANASSVVRRVDIGQGRQRTVRWPAREVQCLALAIYHEAGGADSSAQLGIAQVVLNRLSTPGKDGRKSGSSKAICGVVYHGLNQPLGCLFKQTCRHIGEIPLAGPRWAEAVATAEQVLVEGRDPMPALKLATHFHDARQRPVWRTAALYEIEQIGSLMFLTSTPSDGMIAKLAREERQQAAADGDGGSAQDTRPQPSVSRPSKAIAAKRPEPAGDLSSIFER